MQKNAQSRAWVVRQWTTLRYFTGASDLRAGLPKRRSCCADCFGGLSQQLSCGQGEMRKKRCPAVGVQRSIRKCSCIEISPSAGKIGLISTNTSPASAGRRDTCGRQSFPPTLAHRPLCKWVTFQWRVDNHSSGMPGSITRLTNRWAPLIFARSISWMSLRYLRSAANWRRSTTWADNLASLLYNLSAINDWLWLRKVARLS